MGNGTVYFQFCPRRAIAARPSQKNRKRKCISRTSQSGFVTKCSGKISQGGSLELLRPFFGLHDIGEFGLTVFVRMADVRLNFGARFFHKLASSLARDEMKRLASACSQITAHKNGVRHWNVWGNAEVPLASRRLANL